jgi:putative ABC transport system ATP-binding protein
MLKTTNLSYQYSGAAAISFPDFTAEQGDHWLIIGPSGSGKTTLLHLLGGLLSPTGGSVRLNDSDYGSISPAKLDKFRGENIGIVFQKAHAVQSLSVMENLLLTQQLGGKPFDKQKIMKLLERLQMGHKANQKPNRLSAGEQQRVAIARAVINQPRLILADEPTSALDDKNSDEVQHLLKESAEAVKAILLVVTHDNRLKAAFQKQLFLQ